MKEQPPVAVPTRAKRAGDPQGPWSWVEPSVWTERMLTALEQGVKGGAWYSFRWPNAFFAEPGLYSLSAAHALARQSSSR